MNVSRGVNASSTDPSARTQDANGRGPVAAAVQTVLRDLDAGRLATLPVSLRFWDGSVLPGVAPDDRGGPLDARGWPGDPGVSPARDGSVPVITVGRRALSHLLYEPGELGLTRAYVDGSLAVEGDLEGLLALRGRFRGLRLSARERARVALAALRAAGPRVLLRPPVPSIEASVSGRKHSLGRDRQAIRHHYDLSNEFYRLVLGPTMLYSCAYFADPAQPLEQAQERKLDLICRKLALAPGERFLDIGCGWGSLVLHAAAHFGVHASGVTLSEPQARLGRERAAAQGLSELVDIRVADYRELAGRRFDKIASVGMYEHVGRAELERYVHTAYELLEPGGLMLNHGVARQQAPAPSAKSFLARYVFPDSELHPVADLASVMQGCGFEVRDVESLREHYPLTLRHWLANLREHHDQAVALIGADRTRVWDLWMVGSIQAFETAEISVYQVLAAREPGTGTLPLDRLELLEPRAAGAAA